MGSQAIEVAAAAISDDARAVLDALRRIVRALRLTAAAAERRYGLSAAQLFVLQQLRRGAVASVGELAQRTLTDPSSVSVVVRRLKERGLISSTSDPRDARRVRLALTRKGEQVSATAPETAQENLAAAFATLPPTTRRHLARGMTELVVAMGIDDEVQLFFEGERVAKRAPARTPRRASRKRA